MTDSFAAPALRPVAQDGLGREPFGDDDPAFDAFLHPRSIAVVGASGDRGTISGLLFGNLVDSHFGGTVMPVNRHRASVQGIVAYPDLASCPVPPDLVVVCVPAASVPAVVSEAGDLGVRAVCVISAGFAEVGADGAALEARVVGEAASRRVRLIGPNCTGILGGAGDARFNATFSRTVPVPGPARLLSQSGALGIAVLEAVEARGIGIGEFVSIGNSADVAVDDLLQYWGRDPATGLILLYLESIPDPQRFVRVAGAVGRRVPIVAVKAGRSVAGCRAASSHTAALADSDAAVDSLLRQAGVVRVDSIEEMLDMAVMLGRPTAWRGRGVAVVTNGGGPGILCADACEANGLAVPELSQVSAARLRSLLPAEASVTNPVDMMAGATAEQYGEAVRVVGAVPGIDAVVSVFNTPLLTSSAEVAAELVAARAELDDDVGLVAVFMNRDGPPVCLRDTGIPAFTYCENAARALGRAVAWREWRARPVGVVRRVEVDSGRVGQALAAAGCRTAAGDGVPGASEGGTWLASVDVETLLGAYGIKVPRSVRVGTPREAALAQAELGCPVVVKVAAAIHKSDVGGVRLGVTTPAAAADAVRSIRADVERAGVGGVGTELLVQEQVDDGLEMIVGVTRAERLGPLVMVGLGGKLVEVLGDVAVRLAPLTDDDVDEMLRSLKSYRLLTGYRGSPALDVAALGDVLARVSTLADDLPEVVELDLNPVFVLAHGAVAADVRVRVAEGGT